MTLSWPRSAQKVQAAHNLIMVLGRSSTPGFAGHSCTRPSSTATLTFSPCRVSCTLALRGITPCTKNTPFHTTAPLHSACPLRPRLHYRCTFQPTIKKRGRLPVLITATQQELHIFPHFCTSMFSHACRHSHTPPLTNDTTAPPCYVCLDLASWHCNHSSFFSLPLSWKSLQD